MSPGGLDAGCSAKAGALHLPVSRWTTCRLFDTVSLNVRFLQGDIQGRQAFPASQGPEAAGSELGPKPPGVAGSGCQCSSGPCGSDRIRLPAGPFAHSALIAILATVLVPARHEHQNAGTRTARTRRPRAAVPRHRGSEAPCDDEAPAAAEPVYWQTDSCRAITPRHLAALQRWHMGMRLTGSPCQDLGGGRRRVMAHPAKSPFSQRIRWRHRLSEPLCNVFCLAWARRGWCLRSCRCRRQRRAIWARREFMSWALRRSRSWPVEPIPGWAP